MKINYKCNKKNLKIYILMLNLYLKYNLYIINI